MRALKSEKLSKSIKTNVSVCCPHTFVQLISKLLSFVAPPAYPDVDETAKDTPAEKPQEGKSFVEKVYTHISILPNDHLVPDKDDDAFNEIRRDFVQNQSPQKTPNLENQIVNALKTFMAKAKINTNTGPSGGAVTANRVIRRRRVPVTGNRNGRMF